MKIEEILPALREGKKIRRSSWFKDNYIHINSYEKFETKSGRQFDIILDGLYSLEYNNWEIVKEKKKVKLRDLSSEELLQFQKGCLNRECQSCPISPIITSYCSAKWVDHKDLYSDKFLDQEIEIEAEE